jgi:membrane peptidoglycan carboxypeptidase
MTTEDGGFWRHKGFITSQFEAALRRNLMAGRIRLGASTITMQTVKNVLLSHERTFARKLQELFLTWYIERSLPKKRIMEIYLNVIEFGPGIYGVTRAARHYFGKKPADLTPPEAAYLAMMLPSPVRRHVHYCEGELSSKFKRKHERILRYMQERGRIDDATYELWKDVGVTFDRSEAGSKSECLAQIKRLMEASVKQHADSGLLQGATADPDDTAPENFELLLEEGDSEGYDPAAQDAPGKPAMDELDDIFMHAEER